MKIAPDSWSIVLAGYWNKYLLGPEWVAKNVFQEPTLKVEFALQMELPPRYTGEKNVRFVPSTDRVQIVALKYDDDTLRQMEEMARRLSTTLTHTPMAGLGINFGFTEDMDVGTLRTLFNLQDTNNVNSLGYTVQNTRLVRKLILDGNTLNIKVEDQGTKVSFDFNFHFEVKSAVEIADIIVGKTIEKKNVAIRFLREVYGLELEELEGGQIDH